MKKLRKILLFPMSLIIIFLSKVITYWSIGIVNESDIMAEIYWPGLFQEEITKKDEILWYIVTLLYYSFLPLFFTLWLYFYFTKRNKKKIQIKRIIQIIFVVFIITFGIYLIKNYFFS